MFFTIYTVVFAIGFLVLYTYFQKPDTTDSVEPVAYTSEVFTFATTTGQFTVQYSDDAELAQVSLNGVQYQLERAPSGSGVKYESANGTEAFWEYQGEATLEIHGEPVYEGATLVEDNQLLTFVIGPQKVDCVGEAPMECLVVNGEYFYDPIEGFEFEEGYDYELLVKRSEREHVPADASAYTYRLVELVSKTRSSTPS